MDSSIYHSVNLKNLGSSYFFNLEKDFRIELFQQSLNTTGRWKDLARKVGYSPERLRSIKKGKSIGRGQKIEKVLISKPLLLKLSEISKISLKEIENYIFEIRKNNACLAIPIKLPISHSPPLASIIGHSFGDGCLRKNFFTYGNNQLVLIKNLIKEINKAFNCKLLHRFTKIKRCGKEFYIITYTGTISNILNQFGSVLGNKLTKKFDVPVWIKDGNNQIKSAFIRALFDDESHVSKRDKNIVFKLSKEKNLEYSLKKFLNSITEIINDLNIKTNNVKKITEYYTPAGEHRITLGFTISGKEELSLYKKNISFNSPKKINDLNTILNSYKLITYKPNAVFNKILMFLSSGSKTTEEVAYHIKRDLETARIHLDKLSRKGKINKQSRGPTVWFLGG